MSTYPPLKTPIKVDWQSPELRAMKRVLRIEARKSPHGGTPETAIKLRLRGGPPIERLRAAKRIGPLELAAAEEIERAVTAISAGLALKTVDLERLDRGQGRREPALLVDTVARYMRWARVWAQRATSGDQTFRVVRGALIERQSFSSLDRAIGVREGTSAKATVGPAQLLRDGRMARPQHAESLGGGGRKWLEEPVRFAGLTVGRNVLHGLVTWTSCVQRLPDIRILFAQIVFAQLWVPASAGTNG